MVDLSMWPDVPKDSRPRRIFYRGNLDLETLDGLRTRGYDPIDLLTLPRRNDAENIEYLKCKAQAIEEGTLPVRTEERLQTTLAMQVYGMLNPKSTRLNLNVDVTGEGLDAILGWQQSRHTLRGNTTMVGLDGRSLEDVQEGVTARLLSARAEAARQVSALTAAEQRNKKKKPNRPPKSKKTVR